MKIYTKTGDEGKTSLLTGKRVEKSHLRIEAYGTVDELNSWIGLIATSAEKDVKSVLISVQNNLFTIGSHLADDPNSKKEFSLPEIKTELIAVLETEMDKMNEVLPEMRNFVLPGGNALVANCHIARCVCRRAERRVVELAEQDEVDSQILSFLNRLSDYLFVLSRKFSHDSGAEEIPWNAK